MLSDSDRGDEKLLRHDRRYVRQLPSESGLDCGLNVLLGEFFLAQEFEVPADCLEQRDSDNSYALVVKSRDRARRHHRRQLRSLGLGHALTRPGWLARRSYARRRQPHRTRG